jgi:hypothetical protein
MPGRHLPYLLSSTLKTGACQPASVLNRAVSLFVTAFEHPYVAKLAIELGGEKFQID